MIRGGRSRAASAGKRKRPVFGGQDSDAVIKFDSRNPVTARKEEAAKKTAAKKAAQAKTDAAVAKRAATQKTERDAMMSTVKKDRPMPKRPSAISLANAADPKAKRPAKPQTPPTTAPRPPRADTPAKPMAKKPPRPLLGTVTGKGGRNVGEGRDKRANVTREQLKETGMTLRQYLNFMDREGKRPPKKSGVAKVPNRDPRKKYAGGGMMKSKMKAKGMKAGGKMKSKGYSAGGKMKAKGMKAGGKMKAKGMAGGGKMKAKGMAVGGPLKKVPEGNKGLKKLPKQVRNKMGFMAKGGMMKTKGYSKGGAAGGKKQKVRGAGIARKGVRPAKMR